MRRREATADEVDVQDLEQSGAPAGVTRLDLVCGPLVTHTVHDLARRWGQDRALSSDASSRLVSLVLAAVSHGLRFRPRSVTITLQWLDTDRVRIDVRWKNCSGTAQPGATTSDLEGMVGTLDNLAEEWGFLSGRWGPIQWIVLDTR